MTETISGPWRATRLWNEIIRTMRADMPTKKHKKNLRSYDNCFSSSEGIEWLHKNLKKNSNFGSDVTREQTVQLLNKLVRAKIIENVRDEESSEFKEGELYKFSVRSPVRQVRTPGKSDRREAEDRAVFGDVQNTPGKRNLAKEEFTGSEMSTLDRKENVEQVRSSNGRRRREKSRERRSKEEAEKQQLNLSYFQSLPPNSLIILDNDRTWRRVFCAQLAASLSDHHVRLLEEAELLDMDRVMHNMTRVSSKGIVQLEDKRDDLPHWVLSAMKCLANWPRQLRTVNGKESCLPSYPGFEQDVFNVVKDYFLSLSEPLTTFSLYDYFLDAWIKAEAVAAMPRQYGPAPPLPGCHTHPGSARRPSTQTDLDPAQFYTMCDQDSESDLLQLSHQERTAKIRQTFSCLPPLATSSVKTDSGTNSSLGGTTLSTTSNSASINPDLSTTAVMRTLLPPNSCFETVFMESSPVTRIVPQQERETLHLSRSGSSRSLVLVPGYSRTAGTQTDTEGETGQTGRAARLPRWRRASRIRKSVAVMEGSDGGSSGPNSNSTGDSSMDCSEGGGRDNPGFSGSPSGRPTAHRSASALPGYTGPATVAASISMDDLLAQERSEFLLKYRQVSGDLRASQDLADSGRGRSFSLHRDRSVIESKTVRKEKRKVRGRDASADGGAASLAPALRRVRLASGGGYTNHGLDTSGERPVVWRAPLATQECDLSPVPPARQVACNVSYRRATAGGADGEAGRLPRTSTKLSLERAEPLYTLPGPGPLQRVAPPRLSLQPGPPRHAPVRVPAPRLSLQPRPAQPAPPAGPPRSPSPAGMFKLLALLLPPSYRRRLQLLLKFILKISTNTNLRLDPATSNSALALDTFQQVILRPSGLPASHNRALGGQVVRYMLDHYEQVLCPPQELRREVEEAVYRTLVSRRIQAGEDPYPVAYCEQITRAQYERSRLSGSQAALQDLLDAILTDHKMERKNKKKKLKKFKEAYPDMWRARFPSEDVEPAVLQSAKKEKSGRLSSLSKLKSAIGV